MKTYLGDAVYADVDHFGCLILTTEDGIRTTNRIVLDQQVLAALSAYMTGQTEIVTRLTQKAIEESES